MLLYDYNPINEGVEAHNITANATGRGTYTIIVLSMKHSGDWNILFRLFTHNNITTNYTSKKWEDNVIFKTLFNYFNI